VFPAAFALLAGRLLGSPLARLVALAAFIALPSNVWQVGGGGITRTFGTLFGLLALWQATRLGHGSRSAVVACGAAFGLTALSHPESLLSAALGAIAIAAFDRRPRIALPRLGLAGLIAVLLSAPWWALVLERHGTRAFAVAGDVGIWWNGLYRLLSLRFTSEDGFPIIAALALLGIVVCVARRQWLFPALLLVIVLQPRSPQHRSGVAAAILAGVGVADLIVPRALALAPAGRMPRAFAPAAAGLLLLVSSGQSLLATEVLPLPAEERAAMAWVAAATPPDASFLVVTGSGWPADISSEWFPALARRRSIATVQGSEWTGEFRQRELAYRLLQECATRDTACLDDRSARTGTSLAYVYVAGSEARDASDTTALRGSVRADPRYRVLYATEKVVIAARAR
jgi:hypothetical protein